MTSNFKPAMLSEKVFEYLQTISMQLLPWERYTVLSFDLCTLKTAQNITIKCVAKDSTNTEQYNSLHCIIVQLSYLHNRVSFPIAVIYCNESFNASAVAFIIAGIMHDLLILSIRIIGTVCAPTDQFIQVVAKLCSKKKDEICAADKLIYNIGAVGTFGRQVVHIFDFEAVLSQIRDIFTKVNFEFEVNGSRGIASFEEVLEFINCLPEEVRGEYIPFKLSQIQPMRKLFCLKTISEMQEKITNGLSSLTSHTKQFCEFFAQTFLIMQQSISESNKAKMQKDFYKTLAVLNSMVLIRPKNDIFHDKFIDNITRVQDSIIADKEKKCLGEQYSFLVPLQTDDHTYFAKVVPILKDIEMPEMTEKYFRCFGLNFAMQAVNGVSTIYASLERRNVPKLKLKLINLMSLRNTLSCINKAFELGNLEALRYTTNFDDPMVNAICQAFYNGLKISDFPS